MKQKRLIWALAALLLPMVLQAQDTVIMATTGTDTLQSCNAMVFDNGGPTGSYSDGCNATLLILPDTPGQYVTISGTSQTEGRYDYLTIYEGVGTSGTVLFKDNVSGVSDQQTFGPFSADAFTVKFYSDGSTSYAGFAINVTCVDAPTCLPVQNLAVDTVEIDNVTLSWDDTRNASASYTLMVVNDTNTSYYNSITSPYTVTGLTPNTGYSFSVMADCGFGDTSTYATVSARTACGTSTIPWFENFESFSTSAAPTCWIPAGGTVNVLNISGNSHSGSRYLDFRGTTTGNGIILPPMDQPTNELMLRFWTRPENFTNSNCGTFSAGYITDTSDLNTFVALATWSYNEFSSYEEKDVSLASAPDTARIMLRHNANATNYFWYVDDISVVPIPDCSRPTIASIDSVGPYSAYMTWNTSGAAATEYEVYYATVNDIDSATTVTVNETTDTIHFELTGLNPDTVYHVWVRTVCGSDMSDVKYIGSLRTEVTCAALVGATTSMVNYTAATIEWSYNTTTGFPSSGIEITLTNNTDSTIAPVVVNATGTSYTFTGLESGHNYTVVLRNYCETEITTDTAAVNTISFLTLSCSDVFATGGTSNYVPTYSLYNYSYTQSIYTSEEIGADLDTIYGLAWSSQSTNTRSIAVYMGYTDLTSLSTSNYVPADSLHLVATLGLNYTPGWNTITFDSAFYYDRSRGNLVIAVLDGTGSWGGSSTWNHHATENIQSVYWYQDGSAISMTSPSAQYSGTLNSVPAVHLIADCDVPTCFAPVVSVAGTDSNSISLTWQSFGIEDSWVVGIKTASDSVYTYAPADVTDTFYTFTGLDANTVYNITVGSLCGDDTLVDNLTVRSGCGHITTPYTEDFNTYVTGEMPGCWERIQSGTSGSGTFPSAYSHSYNSHSAPVYFEFESSTGQTEIAALPLMHNVSGHSLTFWASVTSIANYTLEVGVMEESTFVPVDTIALVAGSNYNTAYREYTAYFNNYNGDGNRMAMRVTGNGSSSYTILIDDVRIDPFDGCFPVANVVVTDIDSSEVTLSWVDSRNSGASYVINYWTDTDTAATPLTTSDTSITVTGLNPNTAYTFEVVADCGGNAPSTPVTISALTDCGSLRIPYSEGFETFATSTVPTCWIPISGNVYVRESSSNSHSGSLYIDFRGSNKNAIALPRSSQPTGQLQVSFWTRPESFTSSNCGTFSVGYQTDLADDSTFVELGNWAYNTFSAYDQKEVPMTGAPDSAYIVFRHNANYSYYSSYYWYVDDLLVEPIPDCPRPTSLAFVDATNDEITVSFSGSVSGDYILTISDGTDTNTVNVAADSTYTFTSLTALTEYTITVAADCGSGDISPVRTITAFTTMVPDTLPYSTGFEVGEDTAWMLLNGTNAWFLGSATNNGGSRSLYISNDNGATNNYNIATTTCSYAYKTLTFDNAGDYALSFDWKAYGESTWDFLRVFLVPDSVTFEADQTSGIGTTGTPTGWIALDGGNKLNSTSAWQTHSEAFSLATAGTYNLVFYWRNDGSGGTQPPAAFDNVALAMLSCPAPQQLVLDTATTSSLSFSWMPVGNETSWEVTVGGTSTVVTSPSHTASGLSASTTYNVEIRAICGEGDTSFAISNTFNTECDLISLPYAENFEAHSTSTAPNCWIPISGNVNVLSSSSNAHSGSKYLDFRGSYSNAIAMPSSNQPTGQLQVSFWTRPESFTSSSCGTFSVGYQTDLADTSTFVELANWSYNSFTAYDQKVVPMTGAPDTAYIVFRHNANATYYYWYVDDIDITAIGDIVTCDDPVITSHSVTDNSMTFNFSGAGAYEVGIVEGSTWSVPSSVTPVDSATATHTFTGLTPGTVYTLGVRAICAEGLTSGWTTVTDTTAEHPCFVPTNVTYSDVTFATATIDWTPGEDETSWEVNVTGPSYDQTFATTTKPYTVTGLAAGETFTVKVRALCGVNNASDWSATVQFTTDRCQPVSNVVVNVIDSSSAAVSWTASSNGNNSYELEYGMRGFRQGNGTRVTINGTSTTLNNLDAGTGYDVYVRALCTANLTSEWSDVVTFDTPEGVGIDDVESSNIALYPNPARTTVTISGLESGSTVTVVDLNGRVVLTSTDATLDVSDLAQGAYFVRIVGERQNAIRKLIVK